MAKLDPQVIDHLEWLGFVQPTGLVVSAPALVRAGAILDRRDVEGQRLLQASVAQRPGPTDADPVDYLPDFRAFAEQVLGWGFSPKAYAGTDEVPVPDELSVALPAYDEMLRPHFAVRDLEPAEGACRWQLLVRVLETGQGFDDEIREGGHLEASPTSRMERLLRESGAPAGLLFNGHALRLISAPRGESSGWVNFAVADMLQTAGRPICTAMRLLLGQTRLLTLPRNQRLPALLDESRKFQNEVSEKLAEQVLHALYELLRGFQAAHDASGATLLCDPLQDDPDEAYRAWLTVILRLVFLLYAEERDMLPGDATYTQHYSLGGLFERLREDAALFPDTMDQRFGAWAQLLVLFRIVFDGATTLDLPQRHGALFDPDRFPFLEGRRSAGSRQVHERIQAPLVPDGTIYRVLEDLLILDGERISYRALDVEQIGSVYETMMGFRLETTTGTSVAVKAQKKHGAPTALDLEELLAQPGKSRTKWILDRADRKVPPKVAKSAETAESLADLHAALESMIDKAATPDLVPKGAMVLQPSEERRRSGSHYTPRALTEPIVRTTFEPILARLRGGDGLVPTPEQILDLKVCDPAMGSGAFLVEACRQLGDALIESWRAHDQVPVIPPDEDEVIFARRLVAQRCLYGVDRNPVAVDLAKVSLWLATLARNHALTFVDHALRHGDSLVGLSVSQIENFHWDPAVDFKRPLRDRMVEHLDEVSRLRSQIREADEGTGDWELRDLWDKASFELDRVRLLGDLVIAAFFEGAKTSDREVIRTRYVQAVTQGNAHEYRGMLNDLRSADPPLVPFHWEIEFPESFDRENPGFDAIVGNPPFAGRTTTTHANASGYLDWLKLLHEGSHGNSDLVAHFFRRAFTLIRSDGAFGLIATNTVAQGDTRATGLYWIRANGGEIYSAERRRKWPGRAAVVVSVVHVAKGRLLNRPTIDRQPVEKITAFLFHAGDDSDPSRLRSNARRAFQGSVVVGLGFTFDESDGEGEANSMTELARLQVEDERCRQVIYPYIGGEDLASNPHHKHQRYIINFGSRSEADCRREWPMLMNIVEAKVRPTREAALAKSFSKDKAKRAERWWQFARTAGELYEAIEHISRVLAISQTSATPAFAFLPKGMVYSNKLVLIALDSCAAFAALQNRVHDEWSRFFGSTMKDDPVYTPSDCFETFPFPENWETHPDLETVGKAYYEFRADLMIRNDEGLTKTYNRFHDPDERDPRIMKLRELHAAMDRAMLDAYGWNDVPTDCDFLLDHEVDEEDSKRKKPWRYRWPDEVRDDVLARLLQLNAERAAAETRSGATPKRATGRSKREGQIPETLGLFE
ncbi:MAG: DNA methyltransferase [Actinomycetota bacterium]